MASGKTANLELNQWAKTDPVRMEEFNADNRKIDEELGVLKGRLRLGSFTGDGNSAREISLGFTPKVVIMMSLSNSYSVISITTAEYCYYIYGGGGGSTSETRLGTNRISIRNTLNNIKNMETRYIAIL